MRRDMMRACAAGGAAAAGGHCAAGRDARAQAAARPHELGHVDLSGGQRAAAGRQDRSLHAVALLCHPRQCCRLIC